MRKLLSIAIAAFTIANSAILVVGCQLPPEAESPVEVIQDKIFNILKDSHLSWLNTFAPLSWKLYIPNLLGAIINFNPYSQSKTPTFLTAAFQGGVQYFTRALFRGPLTSPSTSSVIKPIDGRLPMNIFPQQNEQGLSEFGNLFANNPLPGVNKTNQFAWSFQYTGDDSSKSIYPYIPNYNNTLRPRLNQISFIDNDFRQIYTKYPLYQDKFPHKFPPTFVLQTIITPVAEYTGINMMFGLQKLIKSTPPGSPELTFPKSLDMSNKSALIKAIWAELAGNGSTSLAGAFPFLTNSKNYLLFYNSVVLSPTAKDGKITLVVNSSGGSKSIVLRYVQK